MDFFLAACHRKSLASGRRNQVELDSLVIFVSRIAIFRRRIFARREKCDPAAIGRPLRMSVVTRLRKLDKRSALAAVSIKPKIVTVDVLIPIGAVRLDDNGIAIRRNLDCFDLNPVKEFVERKLRFVRGVKVQSRSNEECERKKLLRFHSRNRGIPWWNALVNRGILTIQDKVGHGGLTERSNTGN
jgi:hypothetical protein